MKKRIFNIFNLILLTGGLFLLTTRCVKLEEKPQDFVGPDNFYKISTQIDAAFSSSMNRLFRSWGGYDNWRGRFQSDDQYKGGDLSFTDETENDIWQMHYQSIADLNPAIQALNKDVLGATVSQDVKDQLMAQAKFLRAFNYFSLVRCYGDIPLIIETTNVLSNIPRTPIADIYAQIISDLQFATQNLPVSWSADKKGRPARDAAKGLLAKVYITMATAPLNDATNYVKARDMAKEVMDAGKYSLVHDVDKVFDLSNSYGPEMMWSFNVSPDDQATNPQIWLPSSMASGWGDVEVDLAFGQSFPEQPRKHAYLMLEDWDGKPYTTFYWQTPGVKKFVYDTRAHLESLTSLQNFPIMRYADVLLLFAEAENMVNNGPTQAACDAVNQIINRANGYVPNPADPLLTTSMSKVNFDAAVIQQRSLELCFELDRWYDLVRKRILYEKTLPIYQQNFSENDYLFPIPQADLRLNKLLTQNPGYSTPKQQ